MKLNCGALLLLAIATTYWQICAAVEQRDGGGLSNDDMLASLTAAINDDEGSDTEWEISRLKRVQAVREGEQQRERLRQGREEALRERAALQQQTEGSSRETRALFDAVHAASEEDSRALEALLRSGGDANRLNRNGESPLHVACQRGVPGVVSLLLEAGADPNARANPLHSAQDMPPLAWCVLANHFEATEALLESSRLDVNLPFLSRQLGEEAVTAMDLARSRGDQDMLALLAEYRAEGAGAASGGQAAAGAGAGGQAALDELAFQRFLNLESQAAV